MRLNGGMHRDDPGGRLLRPGTWSREQASTSPARPSRKPLPSPRFPSSRKVELTILSDHARNFVELVRYRFGEQQASKVLVQAAKANDRRLTIWIRRIQYFESLQDAMTCRLKCRLSVDHIRFEDVFEHAVHSALRKWCVRLIFHHPTWEGIDLYALAEWLWDCPDDVINGAEADLHLRGTTFLVCDSESMARAFKAGTRWPLHAQLYSPEGRLPKAF